PTGIAKTISRTRASRRPEVQQLHRRRRHHPPLRRLESLRPRPPRTRRIRHPLLHPPPSRLRLGNELAQNHPRLLGKGKFDRWIKSLRSETSENAPQFHPLPKGEGRG